jgi:hypothetical protein
LVLAEMLALVQRAALVLMAPQVETQLLDHFLLLMVVV